MRIKLLVSYNGEGFVGWQKQRAGSSIQECLESSIFSLIGESVIVTGSGRTDAGVHAIGQIAHFDIQKDFKLERIRDGLNYYLPRSIRVLEAWETDQGFHARKSAKQKTYIYAMYRSEHDNPILEGRALRVCPNIDVEAMKIAATQFVGRHDFYSFMSAGSSAKTTVRTIFQSQIEQCNFLGLSDFIVYKVTADGFLYNMVRKIVTCILQAGEGKISASDIPTLLQNKDRSACKGIAKPQALYLYSVEY